MMNTLHLHLILIPLDIQYGVPRILNKLTYLSRPTPFQSNRCTSYFGSHQGVSLGMETFQPLAYPIPMICQTWKKLTKYPEKMRKIGRLS